MEREKGILEMPLNTKAEPEMESWEVLRRIIPRGKSTVVARFLHVSPDYVRRWCLPPADENDDGTGFRSPIDKVCDVIDCAFIIDPIECALIPEFITEHYRQLVRRHERVGFGGSDARRDAGAELLSGAVAAVNALNVEGVTDNTLDVLVQFIEAGKRVKEKVQAELAHRRRVEGRGTATTVRTLRTKHGGR